MSQTFVVQPPSRGGGSNYTVNVGDFGAVGDGVTNDSASIQAAHDALLASGGGTLIFDKKTYGLGSRLNIAQKVSIKGQGNSSTIFSALAPIHMILWDGGSTRHGPGSLEDFAIEGNNIALSGLIVGYSSQFFVKKLYIQECVDGLVLAGTQNSLFEDCFSQYCSGANLKLAGYVWNCTFIRLGTNQPADGAYHLRSIMDPTYVSSMVGGGTIPNINSRHNTFFHPIMERGSPHSIISLEDDDGDNFFMEMELEGGSTGNPQIYISTTSSNNRFYYGGIQSGGVAGGGLSCAIENHGFATYATRVAGIGWSGVDWIKNFAPGSITVRDSPAGVGTIADDAGGSRVIETYATFSGGGMKDFFGNLWPTADDYCLLGGPDERWMEVHAVSSNQDKAVLNGKSLSALTGSDGAIAVISDSVSATPGAAVVGGGTHKVLAFYRGTNTVKVFDLLASLTTTNDGYVGYNVRMVIPSTDLAPATSGKIRVTFRTTAGTSAGVLDSAWVGEVALSGDPYDFNGSQAQLEFGGSPTRALSGAEIFTSDLVNFAYDSTKNLVVSAHFSGTAVNLGSHGSSGVNGYYKLGADESGTANVSSYTTVSNTYLMVGAIEIQSADSGNWVVVA